jgi:hypothetical protein
VDVFRRIIKARERVACDKMASADHPTAPIPTPLPEFSTEFFSKSQWDMLLSLVDAAWPSITTDRTMKDDQPRVLISDDQYAASYHLVTKAMSNPPSEEDFKTYLQFHPLSDPGLLLNFQRSIAQLPANSHTKLGGTLYLLA